VEAFGLAWGVTFLAYLFQTMFALAIDPAEARRSWLEGIVFPGLVSLCLMALALLVPFTDAGWLAEPGRPAWIDLAALVILGWSVISTGAAWGVCGCAICYCCSSGTDLFCVQSPAPPSWHS
jgi:hypothetical protein